MLIQYIFTANGEIIESLCIPEQKVSSMKNINDFFSSIGVAEKGKELEKEYSGFLNEKPYKFVTTKLGDNFQVIGIETSEVKTLKEELESQRRISDLNMIRLLKTLDDYKEIKQSLENNNSYKEEFISTKSHKMRSSLTNIMGLTEILSELSKEDQREYIEMIKNSSNELLKIVNEFQNS